MIIVKSILMTFFDKEIHELYNSCWILIPKPLPKFARQSLILSDVLNKIRFLLFPVGCVHEHCVLTMRRVMLNIKFCIFYCLQSKYLHSPWFTLIARPSLFLLGLHSVYWTEAEERWSVLYILNLNRRTKVGEAREWGYLWCKYMYLPFTGALLLNLILYLNMFGRRMVAW